MPAVVQKPVLNSIETPVATDSAAAVSIPAATPRGARRMRRALACSWRWRAVARRSPVGGTVGTVERDVVSDERTVRLDHPLGAAVADGEQPAELVDDFVGVEADGAGVVAHERAGEDAGRPAREIVVLQAVPELRAHLGDRRDGFQRNAAALAFAPQAGSEGFPVRHGFACPAARHAPGPAVSFCPETVRNTRPDLAVLRSLLQNRKCVMPDLRKAVVGASNMPGREGGATG